MDRDAVRNAVEHHRPGLIGLSDWLHAHPELGEQEYQAAAKLSEYLERNGFTVERGVAGLATAFVATCETGAGGPTIGFLAEYDALPEIGHACGHNIIGVSCAGAAVATKELWQGKPGTIKVFSHPQQSHRRQRPAVVSH
jgi:metal-dependent amidase/aminoacylase/carboxypeptidase family protein